VVSGGVSYLIKDRYKKHNKTSTARVSTLYVLPSLLTHNTCCPRVVLWETLSAKLSPKFSVKETDQNPVEGSIMFFRNVEMHIRSFQPLYSPVVDSASNRNDYQKIFVRVKRGRRIRLITLLLSVSLLSR
jgi:hypothetical protein